jgi:hypothetical protein
MRTSTTVKALAALGTLSGALWAGTFASFTDTQDAVSTFSSGSVDLRLNADNTSTYTWTAINVSGMKPGDSTYQPLTVSNNGTLGYSYVMTSSATNDGKALASTLVLGMKVVASAAACDSAGVGYAASPTTVVAEGVLATRAITARALAAGASEVLCTYVTLPANAPNSVQGATTTDTMTFTATQS